MKYYTSEITGEYSYAIDFFIELLEENNIDKVILYEMRRDSGKGFYYCDNIACDFSMDVFENTDEYCGRQCEKYAPCNKKSGKCRFLKVAFVNTGKKFLLTKDKKIKEMIL